MRSDDGCGGMLFIELLSPWCCGGCGCCFKKESVRIHFVVHLTLGCDSDCNARKGDDFVIMACFSLIRGCKLTVVFVAVSGGYVKLVFLCWRTISFTSFDTKQRSLLLFVIVRLEKALMHVVIVANMGLLERELDCVGGRFIRCIEN